MQYRSQLSQQTMMNSSLHKLRTPMHSPLYSGNTTYTLSYNFDITEINSISQDFDALVTIIITLQGDQESGFREFIKLYRDTGLSNKTVRLLLRFEGQPNRRIVNYCKFNCENVDIFYANDQSIFDFLQARSHLFTNVEKANMDLFVLSFDLRHLNKNHIFDLLLKHTVGEWKYCLQLFKNNTRIRAVGLFPTPSLDSTNGSDFWFDTFWVKIQTNIITPLHAKDKLESLYTSKGSLFTSKHQIEESQFIYDLSSTNTLEKKVTKKTSESREDRRSVVIEKIPVGTLSVALDSEDIMTQNNSPPSHLESLDKDQNETIAPETNQSIEKEESETGHPTLECEGGVCPVVHNVVRTAADIFKMA